MRHFYPLKLYLKHPVTAVFAGAGLILNIGMWIGIATQIPPQSDSVFLHYTTLFGVDEVGNWRQLFLVPLGGLFILILNMSLGLVFFQRDKYIGHILNVFGFLSQAFLVSAAFLLIGLNS